MAARKSKALQYQKIAVGIGVALVALLLIYLSTLVVTDMPIGGFEEGTHYQLIENPRRIHGDKVEVMEFFSYGCPHCFDLEAYLSAWKKENADRIRFVRSPVIFGEEWRGYARSYYAAEALGVAEATHLEFFNEVQRKQNPMMTLGKLADFYESKGVDPDDFKRVYDSPAVRSRVEFADQRQRRFLIASVPTIVVNGKYRVPTSSTVGIARLLDVVDYLIEQKITARKPAAGN